MPRTKIGQLVVDDGVLTAEQVVTALNYQNLNGGRLASCFVTLGFINEDEACIMLGRQHGVLPARLSDYSITSDVLKLVPREIATEYQVVPLRRDGSTLSVAMVDPANLSVVDALRFVTNCRIIQPFVSAQIQVRAAIDRFYGSSQDVELKEVFQGLTTLDQGRVEILSDDVSAGEFVDVTQLKRESEGAPVIKLVNWILTEAFNRGASDLHIEPHEREFRVRFRIDGVLQTIPSLVLSLKLKDAISSRIKIMAGMNIIERRLPQDGNIRLRIQTGNGVKTVDFRVSTLPAVHGENIVLRLLDRDNLTLDMGKLGFEPESLDKLKAAIQKPVGMVLVTGPTGSGKTNTLYSAISVLNKPDVNIMTVEDPVEIHLPGIIQVQVREQVGLSFAKALRSFLRQDPDIILVGEMRDQETASIAVRAALTGHLVLSTLHTNDAPSTISRLLDMELEAFQVATSLQLICAQRLVRRTCKDCKTEMKPPSRDALIRFGFDPNQVPAVRTFRGTGCSRCSGTGYKGRIGLFEVMEVSDDIREAIMVDASEAELKRRAVAAGLITLRQSGLVKILEQITTIEEIARETSI